MKIAEVNYWQRRKLQLYGWCWTDREVAVFLDIPIYQVPLFRGQVGAFPGRHPNPKECSIIRRYWRWPDEQIAPRIGKTERTVRKYRKEMGLLKYATPTALEIYRSPIPDLYVRGDVGCAPCGYFAGGGVAGA